MINDVEHFFHMPVGPPCVFFREMSLWHQYFLKAPPGDSNAQPKLESLSWGKGSGLELENLSSMSCSAFDWLFSLGRLTSISSSIKWSRYPAPPPGTTVISPSLILLLCKMGIILPHCLNAWRYIPLGSVHLNYCFYCLALGGDSVWLSFGVFTVSACFYYFITSFYWVIFQLIFILLYVLLFPTWLSLLNGEEETESSKEKVTRADKAPSWQLVGLYFSAELSTSLSCFPQSKLGCLTTSQQRSPTSSLQV